MRGVLWTRESTETSILTFKLIVNSAPSNISLDFVATPPRPFFFSGSCSTRMVVRFEQTRVVTNTRVYQGRGSKISFIRLSIFDISMTSGSSRYDVKPVRNTPAWMDIGGRLGDTGIRARRPRRKSRERRHRKAQRGWLMYILKCGHIRLMCVYPCTFHRNFCEGLETIASTDCATYAGASSRERLSVLVLFFYGSRASFWLPWCGGHGERNKVHTADNFVGRKNTRSGDV